MPRHRTLSYPLAALLVIGCAVVPPRAPAPAPVRAAVVAEGPVTAAELRRDLMAFADDSMRGRETGTPDALRAARWIADRLRRLELEPAGDSLFLQRVPLQRETFTTEARVEVRDGEGVSTLRIGRDVAPLLNLGAGIPPTRRTADGDVVFAGFALPGAGERDELAALDIEGKVVVVVNGAPGSADGAARVRAESQDAISERLARILPRRPAAVIVLLAGKGRELFDQVAPGLTRGISMRAPAPDVPEDERVIPLIMLGPLVPGSPLLPAGWPANDRPQPLTGRRLVATLPQQRDDITEYNVAAVVRGRDPSLQSTYVAFGAHYDHVGIVPAVQGDSIANGADDDGSGTVSLLAIARLLQQAPVKPRRSTLLVWHVGEEKGLLGSSWFTDHPTVPIDSIVAQLNADMIGRNGPDSIFVIGPRSAPNALSVRLGAVVDSVNAALPRPFRIDRGMDGPDHPEHIYERSDHFNYARKGIPIVFITTGLHADYHRPSDDATTVDYDKLARVTQLLVEVGRAVGNAAGRPR